MLMQLLKVSIKLNRDKLIELPVVGVINDKLLNLSDLATH